MDLLDRRLLFVTGKGGVGKTTMSAALGLVAAAQGDRYGARRTLIRLASLYPGWHDPRAMLQRFVRSDEIVERLARDLAAIGAP